MANDVVYPESQIGKLDPEEVEAFLNGVQVVGNAVVDVAYKVVPKDVEHQIPDIMVNVAAELIIGALSYHPMEKRKEVLDLLLVKIWDGSMEAGGVMGGKAMMELMDQPQGEA